ncbi:MAG: hypothetical protein ACOYD4_15810 [Solirubrobacterales bacterium]
MPQILVVTDLTGDPAEVVYRERISSADLESSHFSGQLVERVGWAVRDANELERRSARVVALTPRPTSPRAAAAP